MSRRNEDYDENCDPENPKPLLLEDVRTAAEQLRPHIIYTPCMASHYQRDFAIPLYYKLEIQQKTGCFKERGVLYALQKLPLDKKKLGIVVASLGNAAIALCNHAMKLFIPVIVVMPSSVPISKLQKCHSLGAKVYVQGSNLMEAQRYARAIARDKGLSYINCRDHLDMLCGYGTIALEILEQTPFVDAVIVPIGSGGLAAAISFVIKQLKPSCLVYGVQPETIPTFFKSLENGEPVTYLMQPTIADGIAVTSVGANSFPIAQPYLDKVVLVTEDCIARAMLHLIEKERLVVEGAGACPLAAILGNLVPELKLKTVVCILTGGNIDNMLLVRCIERGLSAEGRLVKFKVGIADNSYAQSQLMTLLANGGYNVVGQFQDHRWMEDDNHKLQMKLVCEAKNLEHALELKRIMERAYPCTVAFETEPFNDKRTCPCYVRKPMNFI